MQSNFLATTYDMLDRRGDISLRKIADECGFSYSWISKFSRREFADPGINRVYKLYVYLCMRGERGESK